MKRTDVIQVVGAAAAFAGLGFLFVHSQTPQLPAHTRIAAELPRMKELDAALSFHLVQSRVGLLRNYDPIVATQARLQTARDNLAQAMTAAYPDAPTDIFRPLREYGELLAEKETLIEDYKSGNAVLRNSIQYLPTIAQITEKDLRSEGRNDGGRIDALLRAALVYLNSPADENKADVMTALTSLERWLPRDSNYAAQDAHLFMAHVQTILTEKAKVNGLLTQFTNLPTRERSENFSAAYQAHYAATARQANSYRLALFGACVLLIVFVGGILAKLKRSQANLLLEQETLEQRVAARAAALTQAKTETELLLAQMQGVALQVGSKRAGHHADRRAAFHSLPRRRGRRSSASPFPFSGSPNRPDFPLRSVSAWREAARRKSCRWRRPTPRLPACGNWRKRRCPAANRSKRRRWRPTRKCAKHRRQRKKGFALRRKLRLL